MFGMYKHVFVAVTISRMKRWAVELTNLWFICCSGLNMNHCPVTDNVSDSVTDMFSGSYDRQSVTQRRPCPLNMSLWNWQTTFIWHRQRATIQCSSTSHLCVSSCEICLLSTILHSDIVDCRLPLWPRLHIKQSSATISCITYNCFLFLFVPPVKPVTVRTTFRLTRKQRRVCLFSCLQ